jgi:hypothetical protein
MASFGADVRLHGFSRATVSLNRRRVGLGAGCVEVRDEHACAFLRQASRGGAADASCGASDDRHPIRETTRRHL